MRAFHGFCVDAASGGGNSGDKTKSILIDGRKGWIMRASLWGADALASDQTEPDPAAEW